MIKGIKLVLVTVFTAFVALIIVECAGKENNIDMEVVNDRIEHSIDTLTNEIAPDIEDLVPDAIQSLLDNLFDFADRQGLFYTEGATEAKAGTILGKIDQDTWLVIPEGRTDTIEALIVEY